MQQAVGCRRRGEKVNFERLQGIWAPSVITRQVGVKKHTKAAGTVLQDRMQVQDRIMRQDGEGAKRILNNPTQHEPVIQATGPALVVAFSATAHAIPNV